MNELLPDEVQARCQIRNECAGAVGVNGGAIVSFRVTKMRHSKLFMCKG